MKHALFMFALVLMSTSMSTVAHAQGGAGSSGGGGGGGNSAGIKITPYLNVYIVTCPNGNTYILEKTSTQNPICVSGDEASVRNRARDLCEGM